MTSNKIKNSSAILLGIIMLTAVFAFSNIPPAQAVTETITFDGNLNFDTNYLEDGMFVTSGQSHIHGVNNLRNHSGCCSTPYNFVYNGGDNFTPVSVQVSNLCGTNTLTSSTGIVFNMPFLLANSSIILCCSFVKQTGIERFSIQYFRFFI